MCHRRLTTRQQVFWWLRRGHTQTWIAKNKKINKGLVSRYASDFVDAGLFAVQDLGCNVRNYLPSPTGESIDTHSINKKLIDQLKEKEQTRENGVWVTSMGYRVEVQTPINPQEHIWDNITQLKNGVTQYFIKRPWGTIRYQPDKHNMGHIVLWPTKRWIDGEFNLDGEKQIKGYLGYLLGYVARTLQVQLSLPVLYHKIRETEYVIPVRKDLLIACKEHLQSGDCWSDASQPLGFESHDPQKAESMRILMWGDAKIPLRLDDAEKQLIEIKDGLTRQSQDLQFLVKHTVNNQQLLHDNQKLQGHIIEQLSDSIHTALQKIDLLQRQINGGGPPCT